MVLRLTPVDGLAPSPLKSVRLLLGSEMRVDSDESEQARHRSHFLSRLPRYVLSTFDVIWAARMSKGGVKRLQVNLIYEIW